MEARIDPKSDRFFDGFLDAVLIPKWSPEWLPKPPKIITKSIQDRICSEKRDFLKIVPRLHETLIFEGSWCPERSRNLFKMLQEPNNNPSTISIEC